MTTGRARRAPGPARRAPALALVALSSLACAPATSPPEPPPAPTVVVDDPAPPAPAPAPPELVFGEPSYLTTLPKGAKYVDELVSFAIRPGTGGPSPTLDDEVRVRLVGWTPDGRVFDRALEPPRQLRLGGAIEGWRRALTRMTAGEQRRLWIPSELAHGDGSADPDRPAGDVIYDVELVAVVVPPGVPPVPPDLRRPPPNAKKTPSGLVYTVLHEGHGTRHPMPANRVEVHYTGWDANGRMFDSSLARRRTATFPLTAVIKGWTEGLQLMVEGDRFRFWMPAHLAYGNQPQPGRPTGDLVFEVELVAIH